MVTEQMDTNSPSMRMVEKEIKLETLNCRLVCEDEMCIYGRRDRSIVFLQESQIPSAEFQKLKNHLL